MSLCLSVSLSLCLSVSLSLCLSVSLSLCLSVSLSLCLPVSLLLCSLYVSLSVSLYVCICIYLFICLSISSYRFGYLQNNLILCHCPFGFKKIICLRINTFFLRSDSIFWMIRKSTFQILLLISKPAICQIWTCSKLYLFFRLKCSFHFHEQK